MHVVKKGSWNFLSNLNFSNLMIFPTTLFNFTHAYTCTSILTNITEAIKRVHDILYYTVCIPIFTGILQWYHKSTWFSSCIWSKLRFIAYFNQNPILKNSKTEKMTKFYNNKNHKKIQKPNSLRLHFETLFELFFAAALQKSRKFQKFVENSSIFMKSTD